MKLSLPFVVLAVCGSGIANASSGGHGWTPTKAATVVKARYTTVDPKVEAVIQHNLDQAIAAGEPQSTIDHLRDLLAGAQHAAVVKTARCSGVGKAASGRYAKFHCKAVMVGKPNTPPDYKTYTTTKRLTVFAKGGKIVEGTR